MANGRRIFWGEREENVLELIVVTAVQVCEYTKSRLTVFFK